MWMYERKLTVSQFIKLKFERNCDLKENSEIQTQTCIFNINVFTFVIKFKNAILINSQIYEN